MIFLLIEDGMTDIPAVAMSVKESLDNQYHVSHISGFTIDENGNAIYQVGGFAIILPDVANNIDLSKWSNLDLANIAAIARQFVSDNWRDIATAENSSESPLVIDVEKILGEK